MNLMNLFNFNYLIQNIKKSKALIILLILLVPMFTSIMVLSIESDSEYVMSFPELSIVNIIFMYIVPIVLSMTLFNYVYKKNSVDFIGSMPLSRKTIFVTNTIGGIAIIAIIQLITMISTMFLSKVLSGVIIFGSMVWDVFIFFTIAYIFVFTVSNLAMSFAGNKFSQLVAICLILFLVPFLIMSGDALGDEYSYTVIEDVFTNFADEANDVARIEEPYYFTAPSYIFDLMINNDFEYEYSTVSVVKMVVLSLIYIITGLIIFNKKKLELAGEAYENVNIHLIIKLLTFIPFVFVFCTLNDSDRTSVILFFIAILAVYYFVFDLITNKKVKLKVSIISFIVSLFVMFAVYEGIIPQFGRNNDKVINIDDIQSVYIDTINSRYNSACNFGLLVEDKDLIKLIVTESNEKATRFEYYNSSSYTVPIMNTEIDVEAYEIVKDNEYTSIKIDDDTAYEGSYANLIVTLNNGKEYRYEQYIEDTDYEKIINTLGDQPIKENAILSEVWVNGMIVSPEEKELIAEMIKKDLENLTYKQLYSKHNDERTAYALRLYDYKNHKLVINNYSTVAFSNLYEKMIEICNAQTVKLIDEVVYFYINLTDELWNIIKLNNQELFNGVNSEENEKIISEMIYDALHFSTDEMKELIEKDENNEVDILKDYVVIKSNHPAYYYTNNLQAIYEIIARNYNENSKYDLKLNTNF